jgi:hypothetical protein
MIETSLVEHVAAQPGSDKLCRALAWSEGFSFQLAVCDSPRISTALQLWLADAVAVERERAVTSERISPYPLDWREPEPAVVDSYELVELVKRGLLGPVNHADLIFLDVVRARPIEADAWRSVFGMLNQARNVIARDVPAALTLLLPPPLVIEFARMAADFWSIRTVMVEVHDVDDDKTRSFDAAYEFASDSEILRLIRSGDRGAAQELFRRHYRPLDRFLASINVSDREDIIQMVFHDVLQDTTPLRSSVRIYLLGLARRRASSRLRRQLQKDPLPATGLREIDQLRASDLSFAEIASILELPEALVERRAKPRRP